MDSIGPFAALTIGYLIFAVAFSVVLITFTTVLVYHLVKFLNWFYRPKPAKPRQEVKPPNYEAEAALAQSDLAVQEVPFTSPPAAEDDPEHKYGPK